MTGRVDIITDSNANTTISLNGDTAEITAGGAGQNGDLVFLDSANKDHIRIGHIKEVMIDPNQAKPD